MRGCAALQTGDGTAAGPPLTGRACCSPGDLEITGARDFAGRLERYREFSPA
jgi:hypothetical protein